MDFQNLSSKTELQQHRVPTAALATGPRTASRPLGAFGSLSGGAGLTDGQALLGAGLPDSTTQALWLRSSLSH